MSQQRVESSAKSMPDCIKSIRHVQGEGPDLMADIAGHHPLLGEKKQHVKGGVTLSETKLVILNEVHGERGRMEGFLIKCNDGFHDMAEDWKCANRSAAQEISFCIF